MHKLFAKQCISNNDIKYNIYILKIIIKCYKMLLADGKKKLAKYSLAKFSNIIIRFNAINI